MLNLLAHLPLIASVWLGGHTMSATSAAPKPLAPGEIVAQSRPDEWIAIAPDDLLVMTLAPDAAGRPRIVLIQLMPPPFSEPWVGNIRRLARARWWDGLAIVRVQDNYVAQWGDPDGEDPARAKSLPDGLSATAQSGYTVPLAKAGTSQATGWSSRSGGDAYAPHTGFQRGWPIAHDGTRQWPVHCYGAVGVGRNLPPDAGTGAELYAVIGHAPRHLDANIALVGRVVEGIEHLSSLPRGKGELGFFDLSRGDRRVPIQTLRLASELPSGDRPRLEVLSTESASFARYAEARTNRRDAFFIRPAGGADICNIPVPVRRAR